VAEPPPWPKGWPAIPNGVVWRTTPIFFFSFLIIDLIFKIKLKNIKILMGQKWCVSNKITEVNKI
jgi:hypothetical protein